MKNYAKLKLISKIVAVSLIIIAFIMYFIGNWVKTTSFPPLSLIFTEIFSQLGDFSDSEAGNGVLMWIYVIAPVALGTLFVILNYKRNTTKEGVLDAVLSFVVMFTLLYFQSYFWSYVSRDTHEGVNVAFQVITFVVAMLGAISYLGLAVLEAIWFIQNKEEVANLTNKRREGRKPTYIVNPVVTHSPAFDNSVQTSKPEPVRQMDKAKQTEMDNLDLLLKYKQLLDAGVISKEEYEEKRNEILKK